MSKLYILDRQIDEIIENADPETGEIDMDALDRLKMEREEFLEQIALSIKNDEAEEAMYKAEEKNIHDKMIRARNRKERTKSYLKEILNGEKIKTSKVTVSYRKSESVEVDDVFSLPNIYVRTKTVEEADKVKLKEALKNGEKIDGARLVENINMSVK